MHWISLHVCSVCWQQLARQLENQAHITDTAARHATQSSALRTGVQLHNLGALLLELGRTSMTLRLGQAPVRLSPISHLWQPFMLDISRAVCVIVVCLFTV
jgi:hypothetical protein